MSLLSSFLRDKNIKWLAYIVIRHIIIVINTTSLAF